MRFTAPTMRAVKERFKIGNTTTVIRTMTTVEFGIIILPPILPVVRLITHMIHIIVLQRRYIISICQKTQVASIPIP